MKILVIDEELPYPPDTGKRIRSFNLLSRLAVKHKLFYIGYGLQDSEEFSIFNRHNMNPITIPRDIPKKDGVAFYLRLFLNLFSPLPYIVTSHYSNIFQKTLMDSIKRIKPDIILCEWSPYAIFFDDADTCEENNRGT